MASGSSARTGMPGATGAGAGSGGSAAALSGGPDAAPAIAGAGSGANLFREATTTSYAAASSGRSRVLARGNSVDATRRAANDASADPLAGPAEDAGFATEK